MRPETASKPHYVYRCYNDSAQPDERLVYIGCTVNVQRRMKQHAVSPWIHLVTRVEWTEYPNRMLGSVAEQRAIRSARPLYNVQSNYKRTFAAPPVGTTDDTPLTFQEVAAISGFHIRSIAQAVRSGDLKSVDSSHIAYAQIERWIDEMPYVDAVTGDLYDQRTGERIPL